METKEEQFIRKVKERMPVYLKYNGGVYKVGAEIVPDFKLPKYYIFYSIWDGNQYDMEHMMFSRFYSQNETDDDVITEAIRSLAHLKFEQLTERQALALLHISPIQNHQQVKIKKIKVEPKRGEAWEVLHDELMTQYHETFIARQNTSDPVLKARLVGKEQAFKQSVVLLRRYFAINPSQTTNEPRTIYAQNQKLNDTNDKLERLNGELATENYALTEEVKDLNKKKPQADREIRQASTEITQPDQ
jgi:hypothetical protein